MLIAQNSMFLNIKIYFQFNEHYFTVVRFEISRTFATDITDFTENLHKHK